MRHYAIVGGGPRGLFALESLYLALFNSQSNAQLKVTLFEPCSYPGAGWVWNPEQVTSNWLNITERALQNLAGRPEMQVNEGLIPSFPSYVDWLPIDQQKLPDEDPDQFPPRAKMGTYLNTRFETIANALIGLDLLTVIKEQVVNIDYPLPHFDLYTSQQKYSTIDEVVLTIGHQDTLLSDQLLEWKEHAKNHKKPTLFTEAYPVEKILDAPIDSNDAVGFRGFGLATIDQLRALTLQKGAYFKTIDEKTKKVTFHPSQSHPKKFVPFSLDGLPPVPKPLNKAIDDLFLPDDSMLDAFAKAVNRGACGEETAGQHYFLVESIAFVVTPIFLQLGEKSIPHDLTTDELYFLTINYIHTKEIEHPLLLSRRTPVLEMMKRQVAMATGQEPISLDYLIGQVWRHCQPTIYAEFSYPALPDEVVAKVIELDEASKRYSYGPPVESVQQLIALVESGYLDIQFLNDPDITMNADGWKIQHAQEAINVRVMINAVLDAPQLVTVDTPIIKHLLQDNMIAPKHTDLGIRTGDYGYVEVPEGKSFVPLAVLGRLSKGSVIGVDAILECFGERITSWAMQSVKRMLHK